jgi:hypothetical protein
MCVDGQCLQFANRFETVRGLIIKRHRLELTANFELFLSRNIDGRVPVHFFCVLGPESVPSRLHHLRAAAARQVCEAARVQKNR